LSAGFKDVPKFLCSIKFVRKVFGRNGDSSNPSLVKVSRNQADEQVEMDEHVVSDVAAVVLLPVEDVPALATANQRQASQGTKVYQNSYLGTS
jgi:hypothetical protein